MFSLLSFVYILIILNSKQKAKEYTENLTAKWPKSIYYGENGLLPFPEYVSPITYHIQFKIHRAFAAAKL